MSICCSHLKEFCFAAELRPASTIRELVLITVSRCTPSVTHCSTRAPTAPVAPHVGKDIINPIAITWYGIAATQRFGGAPHRVSATIFAGHRANIVVETTAALACAGGYHPLSLTRSMNVHITHRALNGNSVKSPTIVLDQKVLLATYGTIVSAIVAIDLITIITSLCSRLNVTITAGRCNAVV